MASQICCSIVVVPVADCMFEVFSRFSSKKRVVMPSAAVCIEFDATLWPAESERFTDSVEEVFLEEEDEDDDVPLGMVF
jgi:hypothetical protein